MTGLEPVTPSLPRTCSTPELRGPLTCLPFLERETGFEPATNSLEGCDSTPELLPPDGSPRRSAPLSRGQASRFVLELVEADGFEPP